MNILGAKLKVMIDSLKDDGITHDHTAPETIEAPIEKQKADSKLQVENSSLAKADNKKPAYGTDPQIQQAVLDKFLPIHDRMVVNINTNPQMKMGEKKKRLADLARKKKYFHEGVHIANHVQDVKNLPPGHEDLPSVFLSNGNAKLSKDNIISWNLPAGHTCPGKGDCFGYCYAMQGPQSWPAAMKKRYDNLAVAEREDFVPRMNAELKRWGNSGKKKQGDMVRVHDSGDFYSQPYINKWADIAKSNPDKHFYAYTKAHHLDFSQLENLPNFKIIQSVGGNQDHKIDTNKAHAFIFPSHDALHSAGYTDLSESDLPASDKANIKLGLVIHGTRSGAYDPTAHGEGLKKSGGRYHLLAGEIPDVHKFDQPDAPSQLEYSQHPTDRLKVLRLKLHEGNYSSAMDNKIKHIKEMFKDAVEPTNEQQSEKMKNKYGKMFKAEDELKKDDSLATTGTTNIDTSKASAVSGSFGSSTGMSGISSGISSIAGAIGLGKAEELKKGVMSPGSTDDKFPKTFGALEIDGDLHNPQVMQHHMKLHQKAMLQATNSDSARHHLDNIKKIQDHLSKSSAQVTDGSADSNNMAVKIGKMKGLLGKALPPATPKPPMPVVEKPKEIKPKQPKTSVMALPTITTGFK